MKKIEFNLKEISDLKLIPVDFKSPKEAEYKPAIYFLLNENKEIIYIGKSLKVRGRLSTHLSLNTEARWNPYTNKPDKPITRLPLGSVYYVTWIYLDNDGEYESEVLEFLYLRMYKPIFNFNYNDTQDALNYIKTHKLKTIPEND